jgi:hypothetical protein
MRQIKTFCVKGGIYMADSVSVRIVHPSGTEREWQDLDRNTEGGFVLKKGEIGIVLPENINTNPAPTVSVKIGDGFHSWKELPLFESGTVDDKIIEEITKSVEEIIKSLEGTTKDIEENSKNIEETTKSIEENTKNIEENSKNIEDLKQEKLAANGWSVSGDSWYKDRACIGPKSI